MLAPSIAMKDSSNPGSSSTRRVKSFASATPWIGRNETLIPMAQHRYFISAVEFTIAPSAIPTSLKASCSYRKCRAIIPKLLAASS